MFRFQSLCRSSIGIVVVCFLKKFLLRLFLYFFCLQSTHHSGDSDLVVVSSDEDETKTEIAKTEVRN